MNHSFPVGVLLNSFCLPCGEALKQAEKLGLQGVQLPAVGGEQIGRAHV